MPDDTPPAPRAAKPAASPLAGVKGMNDILPPDSARWEWFEEAVRALMRRYGYLNMRTPIVEPTPLFVRGIGEATDIVEKEMYSWTDSMNGDALTLRPEGTAGVVRAAIEHSMLYDGGKRLFYIGAMFRHERPQRGRYRQFHQVGVEALGFGGPETDAEVILMARALWRDLGLADVRHQNAGDLAHGQQRALEIAMALAPQPRLLLMDEPTAGMSPEETTVMMDLITTLAAERTVVLVEHKMKLVMGICQRLVVLHHGELLAEGTPDEIRNNRDVKRVYLGQH